MNDHFTKNREIGQPLLTIPALKKVLMVGAVRDQDGGLSLVDPSLLRYGLEPLRNSGLPVVPEEEIDVQIMNKADVFGGRDFLTEEGVQADIVILCNIPHKGFEDEYYETRSALQSSFVIGVEQMGHHELSARHWEQGIWARKLKETGAKTIISYGTDSMPLEDIIPEGYFHSRQLKTMPSSGLYLMDSAFVVGLPFSQWVNSHPALGQFVIDSEFNDMPTEALTEPGPGRG